MTALCGGDSRTTTMTHRRAEGGVDCSSRGNVFTPPLLLALSADVVGVLDGRSRGLLLEKMVPFRLLLANLFRLRSPFRAPAEQRPLLFLDSGFQSFNVTLLQVALAFSRTGCLHQDEPLHRQRREAVQFVLRRATEVSHFRASLGSARPGHEALHLRH